MPGRDGETILTRISMLKVFCKEDKERELFQDNFQLFMKNYDHKGAIFMGVFGGKLSEGIDFLDKMARMVIMVGIPYANKSSLRLQAKENYLNERSLKCFGQKVNIFIFFALLLLAVHKWKSMVL
jgi:Rad3-related DNA helicase